MTVTGKTKVVGILGDPISHTASPRMHAAAYNALGLDFMYVPFHVKSEGLGKALDGIRNLNIVGVNVTIPHKESVIPFLDKLDPTAQKVGAVNTIVNENGVLTGYNTDGDGFCYALLHEANFSLEGKSVAVIGAGGSAKAIANAMLNQKIKSLFILNRNTDRARQLATLLSFSSCPITVLDWEDSDISDVLSSCDLVVNTTPAGMAPDMETLPIRDVSWMHSGQLICDIIYTPSVTVFLKHAKTKGALTLNGAGMLAGQGVLAFEKFTGQTVPYAVMRREVLGA